MKLSKNENAKEDFLRQIADFLCQGQMKRKGNSNPPEV